MKCKIVKSLLADGGIRAERRHAAAVNEKRFRRRLERERSVRAVTVWDRIFLVCCSALYPCSVRPTSSEIAVNLAGRLMNS
jgi:hypothetical protein